VPTCPHQGGCRVFPGWECVRFPASSAGPVSSGSGIAAVVIIGRLPGRHCGLHASPDGSLRPSTPFHAARGAPPGTFCLGSPRRRAPSAFTRLRRPLCRPGVVQSFFQTADGTAGSVPPRRVSPPLMHCLPSLRRRLLPQRNQFSTVPATSHLPSLRLSRTCTPHPLSTLPAALPPQSGNLSVIPPSKYMCIFILE